jgi:hypothetical protein
MKLPPNTPIPPPEQLLVLPNIPLPKIICLCGSTRFEPAFRRVEKTVALKGDIALLPGFFLRPRDDAPSLFTIQRLNALHRHKIALSEAIFVINEHMYIGPSTADEIAYALSLGKRVDYLYPPTQPPPAGAPE